MVLNCEINFDQNAYGIYFTGQLLSGSVKLSLSKPKKLRAICLQITGSANCSWTESQTTGAGKNLRTNSIYFNGREDYISTATYLVPVQTSGDGGFTLLPGSHIYKFACALPQNVPTSFEGTNGHIRYTVKVVLERPWKFDHTYKVAFTVLKQLDLNNSYDLRVPVQMEFTKRFCCGPCRSAPLSMVASIPQTGYVPGQSIEISSKVVNGSNISIQCIKFSVRKIVLYQSQSPYQKTKQEVEIIQEHRSEGVAKQSTRDFQVSLIVPPVPPSCDYQQCRVIQIAYEIKIEAKTSGPHESPFICIPITIGTLPLTRNPTHLTLSVANNFKIEPTIIGQQPISQITPSAPPILTPTTNPNFEELAFHGAGASHFNNAILDVAPPTYEEAIHGSRPIEDSEDTHAISKTTYTPRYPVYNF